MNIITFMNYPDQPVYVTLQKCWINQIKKHNPSSKVIIFYTDIINPKIQQFASKFCGIEFRKAVTDTNCPRDHFYTKTRLYTYGTLNFPFIALDCDAIILKSLDHMWSKINDKPFIAIDHQKIPKHSSTMNQKFLNAGVVMVSDNSFFNYQKIIDSYIKRNKHESVPGIDQSLIYDYCVDSGYDYHHPDIGMSWNSCPEFATFTKNQNGWCGFFSSPYEKHDIYINHYWDCYKPWWRRCNFYNDVSRGL